ncbi:hypothetical protein [Chelativorans sp.]|uniref:hypothetical protein n=1 Tax=Chelativorans sp. TaxID=2203393 RepID=UPI002811C434|nr:hypothetical protein [Chelativorans sp.]
MRRKLLIASTVLLGMAAPAAAQDTTQRIWRLVPQGEAMAPGDCVEATGGTADFQPSGQDTPTAEAPGACPPGMVPADAAAGGTSDDGNDDDSTDNGGSGGGNNGGGADDDGDDTGGTDTDGGGTGTDDGDDTGGTDDGAAGGGG